MNSGDSKAEVTPQAKSLLLIRLSITQITANRSMAFRLPGRYLTPSFFCKLEDDVVYWNTYRASG
jgi:hypothetical protein